MPTNPLSSTRPNGVKVTVNHDYIAAVLGNNRSLTANRNGGSVKGAVPDNVVKAWFALVDGKDGKDGTLVERINAFVDGIATLWPDWNKAADTSRFVVGYVGIIDQGVQRGPRKGEKRYVVKAAPKRAGGNFVISIDGQGELQLAGDLLLRLTVRDA
jgi:hypothetical protein